MSVYNGRRHLTESVESLLAQTLGDFELIVVDDGSSDGSGEILAEFARRDRRLRVISNDRNRGQAAALNRGLDAVRGRYLARMDADDVAEPERLAIQISFLEGRSEVGIVGTAVTVIAEQGSEQAIHARPVGDLEIRWTSLLENPFMHPTVVVRRELLQRHGLRYDESLRTAQDYDLWVRLLSVTKAANLDQPLVRYRRPPAGPSPRRVDQLRNHDTVALRTIREVLPDFAIELDRVKGLRSLFVGGGEVTPVAEEDRLALCRLYLDLAATFVHRYRGDPDGRSVRKTAVARAARALRGTRVRSGWLGTALRIIARDFELARPLLGQWRRAVGLGGGGGR